MAGRAQSKRKVSRKSSTSRELDTSPTSAAKSVPTAASSSAGNGANELEVRAITAEAERDKMVLELAKAREDIAALEAKHAQAVNQIDWVLDSLHNIVDEKH